MMKLFKKCLAWILLLGVLLSILPVGTALGAKVAKQETTATAVSVPSVSSPYTTHPTVFIVEDTYQIAFATNATGIAWVEIAGVKYQDSQNGLMNWNSKYHKITVPQDALDKAGAYTVCFRSLSDRPSYNPAPGNTASRTYPFDPIPTDRPPVFYCASDQHGDNANALKISKYKSFDVYYFGGDYISTLMNDSGVKLLLDMTGSVTQGRKPTIYSRGNHEIRGSHCENLRLVSGYSEKTGAYYTLNMPGIFGLVLDAGEDKVDSHAEYGGTVQFQAYRDAQTQWLREVLRSREWEKYPIRMAFCHVPFGFNAQNDFETVYKEWTELLDQMGISLQISGHKHYYGFYGPNSTKYKSDPNYATLLMTDRENGDVTYSASFVTVGPTEYLAENVNQSLALKATKSAPIFTNAYVSEETTSSEESALAGTEETDGKPATKASVPSISSPYTLHPTVFAVEDGYQIIFPTETTGMAWVEVGGVKYYDTMTGLMRYTSKYHSVRVPRVALDTARSYKTCYQSMVSREAYSPTHGSTVSRTYPFTPMADKKEPVLLCLSDFRGLAAEAKAVAAYKTFDALYIGGDYTYNGNSEGNVKILLDTASALTTGTKPVIFTRGNREIRGNKAYLLDQIAPTSATGKSYYTVEQSDFFAIVLDSGEDKLDSNAEYGGTVDYEALRKEQTQWLRQILAEGKWKDYPTRLAFCHMPATRVGTAGLQEEFAVWTEILNEMGISLMISGHSYTHGLYAPDAGGIVSNPTFATLVSCDVDNADFTYSGSFVTLGTKDIKVESVSAAKKLLKTSTTPNLTAPKTRQESDQYLMFDFNNDSVAQNRYHSYVYGGVNFDLKSNWTNETKTTAPTITRGALSFSPTGADVTAVGFYNRAQSAGSGQWAYAPMHYFTKGTDYCQIRFKIDNAVSSAGDDTGVFRIDLGCPNDLDPSADVSRKYARIEKSFKLSEVVNQGYVTLTFPLNTEDYTHMDYLNLMHWKFYNLKSASGATAVISLDYLYIGPEEFFPKQDDYLFFDFTNTEADRQRYDSFTYNHLNFDEASNWVPYNASPLTTIRDGALCLAVTSLNKDESHSVRSHRDFVKVLHYVPGEKDVLQVRLQIRNAAATSADGMVSFTMNFDRSNSLTLADGTSRTWSQHPISFKLADYVDQGWFTLELPLTDEEYLQSHWINLIHPQFRYMTNASGKTAEFLIDYIYVGPEEKSPTAHTVTFCAEDGTILEEQKVAKGSTVSYTGTTPVKAYDETSHYSFVGWVDGSGKTASLNNITESITVYASFQGQAHSYEETLITAPACEAEGVKKLTCSCGHSYQEAISATGHKIGTIAAVAPTCLDSGLSEGAYCTICNAVITPQTEVPPLGHESETIPGIAPGCLTSGLSDGSKCRRCGEILAEQEILPRLGHAMEYTNLGDNHLARCGRCGKESTEPHTYDPHLCICGAGSVETDEAIVIGHSLNLASDIDLNFAVSASHLKNYHSFVLEVKLPLYTGNTQTGTKTLKISPVVKGSYYYFTLTGLTAVHMNDIAEATLYMVKDGRTYVSPTDRYSIGTYAYSQLNKSSATPALKKLCADLLQYGSRAQVYKGYRTDALVDGAMTEAHKVWLTDSGTVTFGNHNRTLQDVATPTVTWVGKALSLESKVVVRYIADLSAYKGKPESLTLKVTYLSSEGKTVTAEVKKPEAFNAAKNWYAFDFAELKAAELRTVLSAAVYEGNTQVSPTVEYSVDTYCNNKTGNLGNLCKAMMAYSDSAAAYFAK